MVPIKLKSCLKRENCFQFQSILIRYTYQGTTNMFLTKVEKEVQISQIETTLYWAELALDFFSSHALHQSSEKKNVGAIMGKFLKIILSVFLILPCSIQFKYRCRCKFWQVLHEHILIFIAQFYLSNSFGYVTGTYSSCVASTLLYI